MSESSAEVERFRRVFLLLLVVAISVAFLATIRNFLMALLLAAVFTGLFRPLERRLSRWMRGRDSLAAATTVLLMLFLIVGPVVTFTGVVAGQAVQVTQSAGPWISERIDEARSGESALDALPLPDFVLPYRTQILAKLGELAGSAGSFLVNALAAATRGTVHFFFMLFVMLYSMFYFLRDGHLLLERILYYMPLAPEDEARMVDRFVSVTRATVKGTLVIGIVQGGLAGLAFAVIGIQGAAFWGTVMALLSIIPGLGTAIVWVPAVIYLATLGQTTAAIGLALWCGLLVGTADNFLRPMLVGKDTKMPDLLILLSTLGGLVLFGAAGIIIGPIVAALFLTIWDIYGLTFQEYLPPVPERAKR